MKANTQKQAGVILIEALVGMLIFLIGVLALMGMQAAAISTTSQAKYRSDAALFASQIVSQMWADPNNIATYGYLSGSSSNPFVNQWVSRVTTSMPGTSTSTNPPRILVTLASGGYNVVVNVRWLAPNETGAAHSFTATSRIAFN